MVGGAAVLSVAYTITLNIFDRRAGSDGLSELLTVGEILAMLLAVLIVVVRAAPRWAAAAVALCVVAASASVLRFGIADRSLTTVLGCAVWGMSALGVSGGGLYLRWLAVQRVEAVRAARRANRLQLAADLHDYVAHDVSEILALAQAGQIIGTHDQHRAAEIFGTIEQAALHSMASLDRAVKMLGDTDTEEPAGDGHVAPPGLTDLDELVSRFRRSDGGECRTRCRSSGGRSHERGDIRDALPGCHRGTHQRTPTRADRQPSECRRTPSRKLRPSVHRGRWPAGGRHPPSGRSSGRGLSSLDDRVTALGGVLDAGPKEPTGWRVTATLPL